MAVITNIDVPNFISKLPTLVLKNGIVGNDCKRKLQPLYKSELQVPVYSVNACAPILYSCEIQRGSKCTKSQIQVRVNTCTTYQSGCSPEPRTMMVKRDQLKDVMVIYTENSQLCLIWNIFGFPALCLWQAGFPIWPVWYEILTVMKFWP